MSVVVEEQASRGFVVVQKGDECDPTVRERRMEVGEILVRSVKGLKSKISLGEKMAAIEFIHFRIIQLLTQSLSSMMYVVLFFDDSRSPVLRRWLSQMVVMGAFFIQFQAWRRRKISFLLFMKGRLTVIGFYVFLACFGGYTIVTINYYVDEAIPILAGAICSWVAFILGLTDVFIQINTFSLPILDNL